MQLQIEGALRYRSIYMYIFIFKVLANNINQQTRNESEYEVEDMEVPENYSPFFAGDEVTNTELEDTTDVR